MAKKYAAELLLKNKDMIKSLDQVIKKTKEIRKEVKKPMVIEAKLGSSWETVESKISKIVNKKRFVQIEARENVTKTMSNVERSMFEMDNKINSTVNAMSKGVTASISPMLQGVSELDRSLSMLRNSAIGNVSNVFSESGAAAATAAAATSAAIINRNERAERLNESQKAGEEAVDTTKKSILQRLKDFGVQLREKAIELGTKFSKGFADAIRDKKIKMGDMLGIFESGGMNKDGLYARGGSKLAQMIDRQKEKLEELGLKSKSLDGWIHQGFSDGPEGDEIDFGYEKSWKHVFDTTKGYLNDFKNDFKASHYGQMAMYSKALWDGIADDAKTNLSIAKAYVSDFCDNTKGKVSKLGTSIGNSLKTKINNAFESVKASTMPKIKKIANSINIWTIKARFACERMKYFFDYFVTKALVGIGRLASKMTSKLFEAAGKITNRLKQAFTTVYPKAKETTVKIAKAFADMTTKASSKITKNLGKAFSKVYDHAKGVAKAIGAAFAGAVGLGIRDLANQEENLISMRHFLKVGDAQENGKRTLSDEQVNKKADAYMKQLTSLGNETPFQNDDIYNAGRRMLQVFGKGADTDNAYKMTQLAADMAALNPGKTAQDAAEALADLAVGETERMKEFGFKLTQDDLKALAGVPGQKDSLSQEQTMKALKQLTGEQGELTKTFGGGAKDLSGSLSGRFSTMIGKTRETMVEALKPFQSDFLGIINKIIAKIDGSYGQKFKSTFGKVMQGALDIYNKNDKSEIPMVSNILNAFKKLKSAVAPIIDNIKSKFGETGISFETVGKLIENAAGGIATVIQFLTPLINGLVNVATWVANAFAEHPGLFKAIALAISGLAIIGPMTTLFSFAIGVFNGLKTAIDIVKGAFNLLKLLGISPVTLAIGAAIAVGVLLWQNWDTICTKAGELWEWLKTLWASFTETPIGAFVDGALQSLIGGIQSLVGWLQDACSWAGQLFSQFKESKFNPVNWFGGSSKSSKGSQKAYGQSRVPYDGYQASLHEGERILTSRQAAQMDAGLLPGQSGGSNNNITINVSGTTDPDTTARMVVQRLKETLENTSVKSFA